MFLCQLDFLLVILIHLLAAGLVSAPKNYFLGWYPEFTKALNPSHNRSALYYLSSLTDYDEALALPTDAQTNYAIVVHVGRFEMDSLCKCLGLLEWLPFCQ